MENINKSLLQAGLTIYGKTTKTFPPTNKGVLKNKEYGLAKSEWKKISKLLNKLITLTRENN